jgi:SAM-dependent methyltransferase
MAEYDLTYDEYNSVYSRFLKRSPRDLFDLVGDIKSASVLDLCAGTLRASRIAKDLGAGFISALDESNSALPKDYRSFVNIFYHTSVESFLNSYTVRVANYFKINFKYDLVVCQQAINYWFSEETIKLLPLVIEDGGYFIFNTFNTKPPYEPVLKKTANNSWECFYCENDMIHHLQIKKGYEPHLTKFKWISPEEYKRVLEANFKTVIRRQIEKTDIYICKK